MLSMVKMSTRHGNHGYLIAERKTEVVCPQCNIVRISYVKVFHHDVSKDQGCRFGVLLKVCLKQMWILMSPDTSAPPGMTQATTILSE